MDENLTTEQGTIPEQQGQAAEGLDETNAAEEKSGQSDNADATNEGNKESTEEQKEETAPALEVKFNKKKISLSREEAVTYAQKGMKYDQIHGDLQKLRDHAARNGKSLSEFVKGLEEAEIDVIRQQCRETADGNEEYEQLLFDKALKERDIKLQEYNDDVAAKEKAEQESLEQRIADGVIAINKLNPEIKDVSQVSENVLRMAEEEGISIREAYLLQEFNNRKAVEAAENAEKSAKEKSSGSLNDTAGEEMNSADKEFLRGLWN